MSIVNAFDDREERFHAALNSVRLVKDPVTANRLLEGLPRKDLRRLLDHCQEVKVSISEILFEPAERIRFAYFPLDSFISQVVPVKSHANLQVDLVGNEGMVGLQLVLGGEQSPLRAQVQCTGTSLKIGAAGLRAELDASPALRKRLNKYACMSLAQFAQTAACNHFHALDARLAHWLLMTADRAQSDAFHLTHEVLGQMLGVRRVGITNAASLLQKRKLLRYRRGDIQILDRPGLEAVSCGCYRTMKTTYQRNFG